MPPGEEEGGSHSGLAISNIVSLTTSRPQNTLAAPHDAKEIYRRELQAFPGDPQSSGIKLEHNIPQLDIARRTTLDHQWSLEDRALQVDLHESPEMNSNIVCEIVLEIVQLGAPAKGCQLHQRWGWGEGRLPLCINIATRPCCRCSPQSPGTSGGRAQPVPIGQQAARGHPGSSSIHQVPLRASQPEKHWWIRESATWRRSRWNNKEQPTSQFLARGGTTQCDCFRGHLHRGSNGSSQRNHNCDPWHGNLREIRRGWKEETGWQKENQRKCSRNQEEKTSEKTRSKKTLNHSKTIDNKIQ